MLNRYYIDLRNEKPEEKVKIIESIDRYSFITTLDYETTESGGVIAVGLIAYLDEPQDLNAILKSLELDDKLSFIQM